MSSTNISEKLRNPAIERMMAILGVLEREPGGLGLKRLTDMTGVTRSTVYRILNSLMAHDMVRQLPNSDYVLGPRLLALANNVSADRLGAVIALKAQPYLDGIAQLVGETAKVSIYDRGLVLVVAVSIGSDAFSIHSHVGSHLPVHAGGASKLLLAYLNSDLIENHLSKGLPKYTEQTVMNADEIRAELELIRKNGWAQDRGEFSNSVCSFAAPIYGPSGDVVAALSVPFLIGQGEDFETRIRETVVKTATEIGTALST